MGNLFVAVVPPAAAVAELRKTVDRLRADAPQLAWVDPVAWHLTLTFLGPTGGAAPRPELLDRLARLASRHARPDGVAVRLDGAGQFDRRVLWARVAGPGLVPLAAGAVRAAQRAGYPVDERRFRPHLTLARVRAQQSVDLRPIVNALDGVTGPTASIDRLVLLRGPARPAYEELAGWPLVPLEQGYQA